MTGVSLDMARAEQADRRIETAQEPRMTPAPQLPAVPGDMRLIAWAGYQMIVPEAFELALVSGNQRQGHFSLADDDAVRIEMVWSTTLRRRIGAFRLVRRHVQVSHRKHNRGRAPQPDDVPSSHFAALVHLPDEKRKLDRYCGYCRETRRFFELVYYHGPTHENRRFTEVTLPSLLDQTRDAPQWWSYFGCRFAAPQGFGYTRSTLNLGDMLVRLADGRTEGTSSQIIVREIYPATLALKRQPLPNWAHQWATEERRLWVAPKQGWGRLAPLVAKEIDTALGAGIEVTLRMRTPLRLLLWRHPRRATMWLIHNEQRNRLHGLFVAHKKRDRVEPLLDELVAGLIREPDEV